MDATTEVWDWIEKNRTEFFALSDQVWDTPETNFVEYLSADAHALMLERQGFRVHRGIADLPTAVMGEAGEGGPVIAILGEYDALPGLSQHAGVDHPRAVAHGGNGHGCGHNLLGTGSMQAATAVKNYLAAHGLQGRVRYYGCPAEEGGSAKGFMVRAGVFDDVDIAISWHPANFSGVARAASLACNEINYHFTGRASHAAISPHLGRSALDAVELMNVGVNYMREHMPSTARIHYAVTDTGGTSPNVVQANATVRYLVRALDLTELLRLRARVDKIAQGAALMTETTVKVVVLSGEANLIGNPTLEAVMDAQLQRLGPPAFDDVDRAFAAQFQASFSSEDIYNSYAHYSLKPRKDLVLCDFNFPAGSGNDAIMGSTDVGSVSWVVPTVQMRGANYAIGTPGHSWQLVAQGKAPAAHKGMEHVAKVMASTAVELLLNPELITKAKQDLRERVGDQPFANPIPEGVMPPFPAESHGKCGSHSDQG